MNFYGFTQAASAQVHILQNITEEENHLLLSLQQKINTCPYKVYLIGGTLQDDFYYEFSQERCFSLKRLHQIWNKYWVEGSKNQSLIYAGIEEANLFGTVVTQLCNTPPVYVFQMKDDPERLSFFIMLRNEGGIRLPISEVLFLISYWKLEQGFLPLHCSGIIHQGGLYLFSGPSGAGKSTISRLSADLGDEVLDEDQVLIYNLGDGQFSANAWGYSFKRSLAPIRAFLNLVKAERTRLLPLSKKETAHIIFEQSLTVVGKQQTDTRFVDIFQKVSQLARIIPGYTLHFRKSSYFWKLIDTEIPVG